MERPKGQLLPGYHAEHPASAYAAIVGITPLGSRWSTPANRAQPDIQLQQPAATAKDAQAPLQGGAALQPRGPKPVAFRSAGVHDLNIVSISKHRSQATAFGAAEARSAMRHSSNRSLLHEPSAADDHAVLSGNRQHHHRRHQHEPRSQLRPHPPHASAGPLSIHPLTSSGPPSSLKHAEMLLEAQMRAARAAAEAKPQLSGDNVGLRMLKAAGWKEGTGLGAHEQGRVAPVQAWFNKGNRGIGFDSKTGTGAAAAAGQKQQQAGTGGAEGGNQQQPVGAKRSRVAELVEQELKAESVETKVARHKQVMAAERDDAERAAIHRALTRALDDPFDSYARSADAPPLARRTRLTATNPLLDSDDD